MLSRDARSGRAVGLALTAGIVELTLVTAYIHATLGGMLFLLNATGYVALAVAVAIGGLAPHPLLVRFSWLPRIGLGAYVVVTIAAYMVMGPYFALGWVAKGVELAILTLLLADVVRVYGSPRGLLRAIGASVRGTGPVRTA